MSKVLIMMATYNGEKYISEQLDSIISQNYSDWELAIQDDGSSDRTWDILQDYARVDSRIHLYQNVCGHHGAYYNFHSLANRFKNGKAYDYYMFSDQDDVWLKTKVGVLVEEMKKREGNEPFLLYADMAICDKNNSIVYKSINELYKIEGRNKYNIFLSHKIFGCNLIMNNATFMCVPISDMNDRRIEILSHDNLYTKFAAIKGEFAYFPEVTMLYRRHEDNVTNNVHYKTELKRVLNRLLNLNELARAHSILYNQSITAISLLKTIEISDDDRSLLDEVEKCIINGGIDAWRYIIKYRVKFGRPIETISRSLILILGLQKKYIKE